MPEEMKEKFKAARDELLQDPEMKALKEKADQAGKEFREAMRNAMLTADPSLADVLQQKTPPTPPEPIPAE